MSKSINELLQGVLENTNKNDYEIPKDKEIPDDKLEIKDQFYNSFKTPSAPRNGSGYSLPRHPIFQNAEKEYFSRTNSIDPVINRARKDPDNAPPSRSSLTKFSLMPDSVRPPHNQVNLIKSSNASYLNYKNRYNPSQQQQQPQEKQPDKPTMFKQQEHKIQQKTNDEPPPEYDDVL